MYRALLWVFFRVSPERIHTWVFALLRAATGLGVSRRLLSKWLAPSDPVLETTVFGVTFPGPLGLAAGFDKNGSGINASDTLKNENFKPHVALKPLLEWLHRNGPDQTTRNAASRAVSIYNAWHASQAPQPTQGSLFDDDGEYEQ